MKHASKFFLLLFIFIQFWGCKKPPVETLELPVEQFVKIEFTFSHRNVLNTFENTFQKDLMQDGVIKIDFWLGTEEQEAILERVHNIDFFNLPDEFVNESDIHVVPDPLNILRIKYEDLDHTVEWRSIPEEYSSNDYKNVRKLGGLIANFIKSDPRYKDLPEPKGGYD